jgi:hypothetical protein
MSDERRTTPPLPMTSKIASQTSMNRLRSAALVAALIPVAQVAVSPVTVSAQCSGCPPTPIPEPAALLMLGPAAAWLIRRRKK